MIDTQQFFEDAARAYRDATEYYGDNKSALFEAKASVTAIKQRIDEIVASVIVNGGTDEVPLEGKNAEQRAAQLTVALSMLPHHTTTQAELREAEKRAAMAEARMEDAANSLSLHRREMDAHIAWVTREAAMHRE